VIGLEAVLRGLEREPGVQQKEADDGVGGIPYAGRLVVLNVSEKGRTMKRRILLLVLGVGLAYAGWGQLVGVPKSRVSFEDFKMLVSEVERHRAERMIDWATFLRMSQEPDTIILDSRSTFRYERIHVQGARHLSFTDFTQENLARVIPSFDTRILIYCNNNFDGDPVDFASKIAVPRVSKAANPVASQIAVQAKPVMMALNIPTYINLYGYGYRNVYELGELVKVSDPRVTFEGSVVRAGSPSRGKQ
jgi:hypothetical protein